MIAIGNPFGLGGTVTAGIISARGRDINAGPYDDFFQIDAADQPRQFGRPELHHRRQVVRRQHGDLLAVRRHVGIGFAIPSNLAKPVVDSLTKFGKVARGWLGVRIQSVTDEIAESLGLPEPRRRAGRQRDAGRPGRQRRRSRPATSSSSSTARRSTGCARCRVLVAETADRQGGAGQAVAQGCRR